MRNWKWSFIFIVGMAGAAAQAESYDTLSPLNHSVRNPFQFHFTQSIFRPTFQEAETQYVLQVVSEPEDGRLHDLLVTVDENGDLLSLIRRGATGGKDEQVVSHEDLFQKDNPLARASGRDAIFVRCKDGDRSQGATIVIKYLHDGVFGSYRQMEGTLQRDASGLWKISSPTHGVAHRLTLRSRTIFGRLIGIDRIDVN